MELLSSYTPQNSSGIQGRSGSGSKLVISRRSAGFSAQEWKSPPYTYAFGNVINTSDPSGLKPTCDCDDDRTGKYAPGPEGYGRGKDNVAPKNKETPRAQQKNPFAPRSSNPEYLGTWASIVAKYSTKADAQWWTFPVPAYSYKHPEETISVMDLGWSWLHSSEKTQWNFKDGDAFTEDLRASDFYKDLYQQVLSELEAGTYSDINNYNRDLSNLEGIGIMARDAVTVMQGGGNGESMALAFLVSHTVEHELLGTNLDGSVNMKFRAVNSTSVKSGTRLPIIGYTWLHENTITVDALALSQLTGMGTKNQNQTITWTETIR